MKNLTLLLLTIFISSNLQAYSKKIILSSFVNKHDAEKSFKKYQTSSSFSKLDTLSKKHHFKIYVRPSGKYYIIVAEPLLSKKVRTQAYAYAKSYYKNAYSNNYTQAKKLKQTTIKKITKLKLEPKTIKRPVENIIPILVKTPLKVQTAEVDKSIQNSITQVKTVKVAPKKDQFALANLILPMDIFTLLQYFATFILVSVLIYYFRKFKKIYDKY